MMRRTFIAVDVVASEKVKELYELVRYRMRLEKVNWVATSNLHITLNFLGETEEELLPAITQSIESVIVGQTGFKLLLRSFGVFKSIHDPRVVWIGCDPCPPLQKIKKELDNNLSRLGFKPEYREFSPHLTLGRIKEIRQINQLAQLVATYKDAVFQEQLVKSIVLYESRLTSTGSEYTPIRNFLFPLI